MLPTDAPAVKWEIMPKPSKVVAYSMDAFLVLAPLSGILYFLFNPDAFNAFLGWIVRTF